jgi:hypothetical protein
VVLVGLSQLLQHSQTELRLLETLLSLMFLLLHKSYYLVMPIMVTTVATVVMLTMLINGSVKMMLLTKLVPTIKLKVTILD